MIPEIYFSKLELIASLLDGEDSYEAAQKQKNISAEDLIDMLMIAGKYLKSRGENEKASSQFRIAKKIMDAFSEDFVERKWFNSTVYERTSDRRAEIEKLLNECESCMEDVANSSAFKKLADIFNLKDPINLCPAANKSHDRIKSEYLRWKKISEAASRLK